MADRQAALSRLAARDCIESVLQLRHPSVERLAAAVRVVDDRQRRDTPQAQPGSSAWWWAAAPPAPTRPPDLGSNAASAVGAEIWGQAVAAGLTPVDRLTFSAARDRDVSGRLRFQVVSTEPVAIRPWLDLILVPVERAYYEVIGADPPEIFTATASVAVGRIRNVGIHLPTHATPHEVREAIGLHIGSFAEILSDTSPAFVIESLLRQKRFSGEKHSEWRLPMAMLQYGRREEAQQALEMLLAAAARRPHGRRFHELQWIGRRLGLLPS